MARNFKTQLAGQIGESLVVAELGRCGIVANTLAGNVPDIDLLAYRTTIYGAPRACLRSLHRRGMLQLLQGGGL
ncbi:hypothetical protein HUK65_12515 [Rhodobacteraceae bacterium 2376]|uniref:Uncharacterized protein n=1 Tax=Rhabdonatronobacter sediminivivens TaxID=2743469 RepID=A0A7Z0I0R8_9RHOB|nr:hypothetical protein [Rhabdonatronobacter sediminivivens]NYS25816.1 hypothetical protein [Rhabdonatronobacter sediminivivens]